VLTDIAFNSTGTLYGTTFTGLFTLNTSTGAATAVGNYSAAAGSGMNALVGNGVNLFGASTAVASLFSINATNAALTTVRALPANSAGDLAFVGGTLFESAVDSNGADELVNASNGTVVGAFHVGSAAGATLDSVFGLADDGTTLYGVAGTEIYSVDAITAILIPLFDYSTAENGQSLGAAFGAAFINEATLGTVPEPASLALIGLGVLAGIRTRKAKR
jgi:hypothetical protein